MNLKPPPLVPSRVTNLQTQVQSLKVPRTKTKWQSRPCAANSIAYAREICALAKAWASAAGQSGACRVTIVQSGYETGWGTHPFFTQGNNCFGFHGEGDAGWVPAAENPKVHVSVFSSRDASFKEYWSRVEKAGVTYQSDAQFIRDVTTRCAFAVGRQNSYISDILDTLGRCDQDLAICCAQKPKKS